MPASVPVSPVGPVAAATLVFRENGQLRVAAIVKASFAFTHHGPMRVAPPEPIFVKEVHRMNNPTRSIMATSDLVPRLPGADVLLLGQAHAPGGGAARITVRLAIGRGDTTMLDKRVHVFGDQKGQEIKPFVAIPLVYEKAYGGPGYRENPIGTGVLEGDAPPNILDPQAPDRVAGFAPISKTWPARTQLAPPEVRAALERPVAEIPPGFDFRYFHAAPPDQRLAQLVGDEWIVLEGVHPEHTHLHMELPGAMAMVRVVGTESDGRVFSLRADTLRIDPEAERCTIVWRNSFPVRESDLESLRLLAGVALPDVPIAWPLSVDGIVPAAHMHAAAGPIPVHRGAGGTLVIEETPLASTFGGTMEIADEDLEAVEEIAPDFSKTSVLESTAVLPTQPLPAFFRDAPKAPPPPPPAARRAFEGTLDLTNDPAVLARAILPFAGGAPAPAAVAPRVTGPIPGAPWAPEEEESPPSFEEAATQDAVSPAPAGAGIAAPSNNAAPPVLVTSSDNAAPPAFVAASVPVVEPAAPAPAGAAAAAEPVDPWGRDLDAAPAAEAPPPGAEPQKAVDSAPGLRSTLYKRFKK